MFSPSFPKPFGSTLEYKLSLKLSFLHEVRRFTGYWSTTVIWASPGDIIKALPMKLNHRLWSTGFSNLNSTHPSRSVIPPINLDISKSTTKNHVHPDTLQEEIHSPAPEGFLPKMKLNQNPQKSLVLTTYLQEIRELEKQIQCTLRENNQPAWECGKSTKCIGPCLDSDSHKPSAKGPLRQEGKFASGDNGTAIM